jgi:hypothetical protein
MDIWWGYFGVQLLNVTAAQREALIVAFQSLRGVNPAGPQHINHWRIRLDRLAAIFEAQFDQADLTVARVTQFLANAVGVSPGIISADTTQTARGPLVTFSAGGTDRLQMIVFGGVGATRDESHTQTLIYLDANRPDWGL